jgi:hypothetical protein
MPLDISRARQVILHPGITDPDPVQTVNGQNKQDAAQDHKPEPGPGFRFHARLSFLSNKWLT